MDIKKRINEEKKRISVLFESLPGNQRSVLGPLIENAAFMKVTLEDLQETIMRDGVTDQYQNGENQHGVKPSACLQSYNSLLKNYLSVVRTLRQHLPPERRAYSRSVFEFDTTEETPEELEAKHRVEEEHQAEIRRSIDAAIELQRKQREEEARKKAI